MKVILKADDLAGYPGKDKIVPQRWQKFVNIVRKYNKKANIGVIGNSLIFDDKSYFDWIKKNSDVIEYFNHGFLHRQFNFDGEIYQEFKTTSLEYQIQLLECTNKLFKEKIGLEFLTFGVEYNAVDENTNLALKKAGLKVGFFLEDGFEGINLKKENRIELEVPVHRVNLSAFKENFIEKDYIVIQTHPNSWDDIEFEEFENFIKFLDKYEFVFAKEMI